MSAPPPGTPLTDDERQLVLDNLGLVHFVLNRMTSIRTDMVEDRFQDGTLGLMRAVQLYNPDTGFKFSTYAIVSIRRHVNDAILAEQGVGFRAHWRAGTTDQHRAPMYYDGFAPDGSDGDDNPFANTIADGEPETDELAAATELHRQLHAAASALCRDDVDRDVVAFWFDDLDRYHTHAAVLADRHGCSPERIRQRRRRLEDRLRELHYGLTP